VAGERRKRRDWRGSGLTLTGYAVVGGIGWLLLPDRFGEHLIGLVVGAAGVMHGLFVLLFPDPPYSRRRS
jgi:hypothetical protein